MCMHKRIHCGLYGFSEPKSRRATGLRAAAATAVLHKGRRIKSVSRSNNAAITGGLAAALQCTQDLIMKTFAEHNLNSPLLFILAREASRRVGGGGI